MGLKLEIVSGLSFCAAYILDLFKSWKVRIKDHGVILRRQRRILVKANHRQVLCLATRHGERNGTAKIYIHTTLDIGGEDDLVLAWVRLALKARQELGNAASSPADGRWLSVYKIVLVNAAVEIPIGCKNGNVPSSGYLLRCLFRDI